MLPYANLFGPASDSDHRHHLASAFSAILVYAQELVQEDRHGLRHVLWAGIRNGRYRARLCWATWLTIRASISFTRCARFAGDGLRPEFIPDIEKRKRRRASSQFVAADRYGY
jgi:hypothetical protein